MRFDIPIKMCFLAFFLHRKKCSGKVKARKSSHVNKLNIQGIHFNSHLDVEFKKYQQEQNNKQVVVEIIRKCYNILKGVNSCNYKISFRPLINYTFTRLEDRDCS